MTLGSAIDASAAARPAAILLAGVHLRLGLLALARTELEILASEGALDAAGRIDLAEVRWRTGDLAAAGEIAGAILAGGDEPVVALVVAAEAAAALGRPSEARRLAGRALARIDGPIDAVFAGLPRSAIWPEDPSEPAPSPTTMFQLEPVGTPPASDRIGGGDASATEDDDPEAPSLSLDEGPGLWDAGPPAASDAGLAAGRAALAAGRAALAAGDPSRAAIQLGLLLRREPARAADVLEVIGSSGGPALSLVRGDALRAMGQDAAAERAYAAASEDLDRVGPASASRPASEPPPPD